MAEKVFTKLSKADLEDSRVFAVETAWSGEEGPVFVIVSKKTFAACMMAAGTTPAIIGRDKKAFLVSFDTWNALQTGNRSYTIAGEEEGV